MFVITFMVLTFRISLEELQIENSLLYCSNLFHYTWQVTLVFVQNRNTLWFNFTIQVVYVIVQTKTI